MASWVISECGLRPLPKIYTRPGSRITRFDTHKPIKIQSLPQKNVKVSRNWGLKVSVPYTVQTVNEEEDRVERIVNGVSGVDQEDDKEAQFDPGAPPPFKLADIRAAIPKHCFVKDPWRSMSYVVRDVLVVCGLAAVAAYFNSWAVWPLYWLAQGTMFWAIFVLGHDW